MREVYRDRWLLVVDKPSGQPTQGTAGGQPGLFEALQGVESQVFLHHRLDQPASGLVIFALDPEANRPITEALRAHRIQRRYRAVLAGRAADGSWTTKVDGKKAKTDVAVLGHGAGMTAAAITLRTGRKHQIRVHAAMAGTPIVGDRRYGGPVGRAWPRLALHAAELIFAHPVTGKRLELAAPIPDDLAQLWGRATG